MAKKKTPAVSGPRAGALVAGLVVLRLLIGWHFLYEGLAKLLAEPAWSAEGYLRSAHWLLADTFHWMADTPEALVWVDRLNIWGLMAIGAALLLGLCTRGASLAGIALLALYYVAHPPLVGVAQPQAEGSYLIVNKNLVEAAALFVLLVAPGSGYAGAGRYLVAALKAAHRTVRRAVSRGETPLHVDPEGLSRRELVASLATLPVLGGFIVAVLKKHRPGSHEESLLHNRLASVVDAHSGASIQLNEAVALSDLKGPVPQANIGPLTLSRIILGGNLMNGFAHARDLMYVAPLVKRYHTDDKVMETLWLAEQCGINALILNTSAGGHFVDVYQRRHVGQMRFIAQCRCKDLATRVRQAIDLGCSGAYIQSVEELVDADRFDEIAEALDMIRQNGLVAGYGSHHLAPIKACVERGIDPDFVMKTFHHDNYWSAMPDGVEKDNRYCDDRDETIDFMRTFDKPWIAFKVLAAGAIHPRDGFRYAFEQGADFVCVGVYDWQVVEDANIAFDILKSDLKRDRPWRDGGVAMA